jgi:hypothetical protein
VTRGFALRAPQSLPPEGNPPLAILLRPVGALPYLKLPTKSDAVRKTEI